MRRTTKIKKKKEEKMKPGEWRSNIALKSGFIESKSSWTNLSAVFSFRIRLFSEQFFRWLQLCQAVTSANLYTNKITQTRERLKDYLTFLPSSDRVLGPQSIVSNR
jgi:hypothetical protein